MQVDNLEVIHSRFSIHRQAIKLIRELPSCGRFMSICEELILNVRISLYYAIDLGVP